MPVPGAVQNSPRVTEFQDYIGRKIVVTLNFNETTRAIISGVVHRDDGCLWHTVVFDNPGDTKKARRLPAPDDGEGDRTYTPAQFAAVGYSTIDQAMAVQITAEP